MSDAEYLASGGRYLAARAILQDDWNPIGLDDPGDEYDGYLSALILKIDAGASIDQITKYLSWVREEHMGLSIPNRDNDHSTAEKLIALWDKPR